MNIIALSELIKEELDQKLVFAGTNMYDNFLHFQVIVEDVSGEEYSVFLNLLMNF